MDKNQSEKASKWDVVRRHAVKSQTAASGLRQVLHYMHFSDDLGALQAALTNFCAAIATNDEAKFCENRDKVKQMLERIEESRGGATNAETQSVVMQG